MRVDVLKAMFLMKCVAVLKAMFAIHACYHAEINVCDARVLLC
jgi:hypothetical protein